MRARMRQRECSGGADFRAEANQVQVQRARFVQDFFWSAAKFLFQSLQMLQQAFRRFTFTRDQTDGRVYEAWRAGWAIDGRRFPERGFEQRPFGECLKALNRLPNQ